MTTERDCDLGEAFLRACGTGDLETVEKLLAANPGLVDVADVIGMSGLHWSVMVLGPESQAVTALLLRHGASVNLSSSIDGNTPLHCAARSNNAATAMLLIAEGANFACLNQQGLTMLDEASMHKHHGFVETVQAYLTARAAERAVDGVASKSPGIRSL